MKYSFFTFILFLFLSINVSSKPVWELFAFKDYGIPMICFDYNDNLYVSVYDKNNDIFFFCKSSNEGKTWNEIKFDSLTWPKCIVNIKDSIIIFGMGSLDPHNSKCQGTMRSTDDGNTGQM